VLRNLSPCVDPLLMPMFRERCSSLHQSKKQPNTQYSVPDIDTQYQVASCHDKVNCNVHETLALTIDQNTETTHKPLSIFKENIRENLKSASIYISKE